MRSTFAELESFQCLLSYDTEAPKDRASSKSLVQSGLLRFGEEGLRALCRLLDKHLRQRCQDIILRRHLKKSFPASAKLSGISPPKLDRTSDGEAMIIESTNLRIIRRVVAPEGLYGSSYSRFDTVLFRKEATKR